MSDERKFEKAKKDVTDTVADESKDVTDSVADESKDVTDSVADESKDVTDTVADESKDVTDTVAEDLGEQNYFTDQAKKLREKAAQIVEDDKSAKPESPRIKTEPDLHSVNQATTERGREVFNMMGKKPLVIVLIIGAIVIGAILIYALVQYSKNQSYIEENFNASWNQSLDSLRSGNVSVTQYCNQNPHDQKLCDLYWDLKFL